MTTTRRTFTFASLAVAAGAASTAHAGELGAETGKLAGRWTVERRTGELVVTLAVVNVSGAPVSILIARGSRPGAHVSAVIAAEGEEIALAEIRDELGRRETMSRMAPLPQYRDLVAGATHLYRPSRFTLPEGAEREVVRCAAEVWTSDGPIRLSSGPIGPSASGKVAV